MTILFAGGEDTSFALIGSVGVAGNIAATFSYRSNFARCSLEATNSGAADPPANRIQTPSFTPVALLWVHGTIFVHDLATTLNQQSVIVRSPDGVSRIVVRQTGNNNELKVSTRSAAGVFTDLATVSSIIPGGTLTTHIFDMMINYIAAGSVQMWLDGVRVINFTGDPRTDSATQLNQVEFAGVGDGTWSELICADQDTRNMALWTMVPQAAGATQSWTPNTLGNINETGINDTTAIATTSNNALSEWTQPLAAPNGAWLVRSVVQNARVSISGTGPQHFDWLTRTGAIDFLAGAPQAPALTVFGNFQYGWPTNPNTTVGWTIADITAVGFNLGIESQA
jgi:hypothetical protein